MSGLLFLAAGAFALSRMSDSLSFFLSFSGVSAVAFAVIAMHVVATAVSPFFQARRGLAVGLATAGATAGQLFVIPAFAAVSDRAGWRAAYLVLALTAVAVAAVAFVALPRREGGGKPRPEASAPSVLAGLAEMLRAPSFHALFWSYAICGFTTAGVVETHLMAYTAFCGIGPVTGATAFGLLSAVNMGGMILAGHLSDRMPRALVLSSIYAARAGSFILLLQVGGAPGVLFVFAVLFGLFDYSTVPVTAGLVAERLGLRLMGLTMGVLATGHALGAAAGSFIGGYLFDISSHYGHTWVLSGALALIASFVVLPLARFRPAVSLP